jgi:hypothetical protein
MPGLRLRKRLIDRLVKGASSASDLGLALLMTAGVARCGGSTTDSGEGTADAAADHGRGGGPVIEAPQPVIEAVAGGFVIEAGGGPIVEAAVFPDAGSDGNPSPIVEAPPPPREAGSDAHDAGSDGHISPMIEAPSFTDT